MQSLITGVLPDGLNLQILGFFEGTVEQLHLRHDASEKAYKIGKKVKARVLYDFSSTPPRFALALNEHVLGLGVRQIKSQEKSKFTRSMQTEYPIGRILEAVKVVRVEPERGIIVEVEPSLNGFVHVSPMFLPPHLTSDPLIRFLTYRMSMSPHSHHQDPGSLDPFIEHA